MSQQCLIGFEDETCDSGNSDESYIYLMTLSRFVESQLISERLCLKSEALPSRFEIRVSFSNNLALRSSSPALVLASLGLSRFAGSAIGIVNVANAVSYLAI